MIWLTWRQFRTPALVVYVAVGAIAAVLAFTGPHLADLYRTYRSDFFDQLEFDSVGKGVFLVGSAVVSLLPAVIGAFWGAPLVARELEAGTHKLVWNQSVTRRHWLTSKLGLIGAAAAIAGLVSLAMTWWCAPIDKAIGAGADSQTAPYAIPRLSATIFGARGLVPIGYAVLACTIGVTVGLILRRTVAAMAVTLVIVAAVQIVLPLALAPRLLTPVTKSVAITGSTLSSAVFEDQGGPLSRIDVKIDAPGAWITANETINPSGRVVTTLPAWTWNCAGMKHPKGTVEACYARLAKEGYYQRVVYQPANRYWKLQWIATAILLGFSLLLTGFSFWWLRSRLS